MPTGLSGNISYPTIPGAQSQSYSPGHCSLLWFFQRFVSRCSQLYANRQLGAEEVGVPVPNELCQEPARQGNHGRQYLL